MLSRTILDRLLKKIDNSGVSKDGIIEFIDGLFEWRATHGNYAANRSRNSRISEW